MERGPLATDKVRYVGDPVAVVLAETRYAARDGAAAVDVDYDPLPAVVDPEKALEEARRCSTRSSAPTSATPRSLSHGDVDGAFASADKVVTLKVVNQRVLPVAMETRGCLADWRPDGAGDLRRADALDLDPDPARRQDEARGAARRPREQGPRDRAGGRRRLREQGRRLARGGADLRLRRCGSGGRSSGRRRAARTSRRRCTGAARSTSSRRRPRATAGSPGIKVTAICDIGGYYQYVSPLMGMLTGLMLPGPYDIENIAYELKGV